MMRPYRNQKLFSNYYLDHYLEGLLKEREFKIDIPKLKEVYQNIKALWDKNRFSRFNEPQLRQHLLNKVFEYLDWTIDVEPPTPVGEARHPDYALFSSKDKLEVAQRAPKEEYFNYVACLAEAKRWERNLDKKIKADVEDIQNPSLQMGHYLWLTEVKWGILTNGRSWRLYERETSKKVDIFYEIDLEDLLENGTVEDFKYFFLFFRKDAFPVFVEKVYKGSKDYAEAVGEELKENVYQSLKILAQGFLEFPQNNLSPIYLKEIHDNSLIFLYRLLFIFYAEYSQLLPRGENKIYTDSYSLDAVKNEIADKLDKNKPILASTHTYWNRLKDLFEIINNGNEELGVPPYNGGLFDPKKHDFLEVYKVGDIYIAKVIDLISRSKDKAFIDYSSLDIRHLGSIYEGLLEYKVTIAEEDLVPTKEKGKEIFIPLTQAKKQGKKIDEKEIVHTGDVYLATDKGERKATGSYYTPDYIVKYIIENTLGPLINNIKKEAGFAKVIKENKQPLEKIFEELVKEKEKIEKDNLKRLWQLTRNDKERKDFLLSLLDGAQPKHGYDPIEMILQLKVLDPAMGSGHFLVEATDYLARELLRALSGEVEAEFIERETRGIKEPSTPYEKKFEEEDIRWARREIVERCIFGVDLNPLAVELAKLSLWLYTVSKNRPLNFLDHHLRCGNSLIGAKIDDLAVLPSLKKKKQDTSEPRQLSLFESTFREKIDVLLGALSQIEALSSDTVEQIRKKEGLYQKFRKIVAKFQDVADVWTSIYFGNEISLADYEQLHNNLRGTDEEWAALKEQSWFKKAKEIAEKKHFFHWELEFPEVFFEGDKKKENPGFDAVVGNPPYVTFGGRWTSKVEKEFDQYLRFEFPDSSEYKLNTYASFMDKSIKLLKLHGFHSFIVPDGFLLGMYFSKLRSLILSTCSIIEVSMLSFDPWESGQVGRSIIYIFYREENDKTRKYNILKSIQWLSLNLQDRVGIDYSQSVFHNAGDKLRFRLFFDRASFRYFNSVKKKAISLGQIVEFYTGLRSRVPKNTIISRYKRGSQWKECLFVGENVERFYINKPNLFVNLDRKSLWGGFEESKYHNPKIFLRKTGDSLIAAVDQEHLFSFDNLHVLNLYHKSYNLLYLICFLNSNALNVYYRLISLESGRALPQIDLDVAATLPIRRIAFVTPRQERERLVKEGKGYYSKYLAKGNPNTILYFIESRLMKQHKPDPELVKKHNADPLNKDWQIPEGALWEQSDVVHDILAFLAEQMIELNKIKQKEIKGFLTWLEAQLKIKPDKKGNTGIEALTGKTQLKNYLGDYQKGEDHLPFEEFWKILEKNKTKIDTNIKSRALFDAIKSEYEKSLSNLLPIKEKLHRTDWLIDQIVYKLYGLTEEEIKIVEGR